MPTKSTPRARAARKPIAAPAADPRPNKALGCHFCGKEDRLALTRLIVGSDERLVWACARCKF